jgi:transposase
MELIALHRVRSTWIATRTARINTARGILREFGIVVGDGASRVPARVTELIEDAGTELPMGVRDLLNELVVEIRQLTSRIENVERQLAAMAGETPVVERLRSIPGIGLLTATALIAFVGNVERRTGRC